MRILLFLIICSVASPWVIYRKSHRKRLICREETEWGNNTRNSLNTNSADRSSDEDSSSQEHLKRPRRRRDIDIDPVRKEPIIYLGTPNSNNSIFIDDGDFDIVSDQLTKEEIKRVKQQIMDTCNALNGSE